jgi:amino acid transporter
MSGQTVRTVYLALATLIVVTVIVQIPVSATNETNEDFFTAYGRATNLFFYFTIVMNLLVAFAATVIARRPERPRWFPAVWISALSGITLTGVVYHLLLAAEAENTGIDVITNLVFHTIVPIAAVLAFILLGPRNELTGRAIAVSTVIPLAWIVVALIRGEIIDFYPYPFLDVNDLGYVGAFGNLLGVTAAYLIVAGIYLAADRVLARRIAT